MPTWKLRIVIIILLTDQPTHNSSPDCPYNKLAFGSPGIDESTGSFSKTCIVETGCEH